MALRIAVDARRSRRRRRRASATASPSTAAASRWSRIDGATLAFDVSAETLRCTTGLDARRRRQPRDGAAPGRPAGRPSVSGHVDGVGTVTRVRRGGRRRRTAAGASEIDAPPALARFIAAKGSIAVDGVSLTVNDVTGRRFAVNLIPHTLAVTTLGTLAPGARVNLEVGPRRALRRAAARRRTTGAQAAQSPPRRSEGANAMDLTTLERLPLWIGGRAVAPH